MSAIAQPAGYTAPAAGRFNVHDASGAMVCDFGHVGGAQTNAAYRQRTFGGTFTVRTAAGVVLYTYTGNRGA